MTTVTPNPMNARYAPNEACACYASETDFRRFVAYGMQHSYFDSEELGGIEVDDEMIRELREAFLEVLETTIQNLLTGDFEVGQEHFDVDYFALCERTSVSRRRKPIASCDGCRSRSTASASSSILMAS